MRPNPLENRKKLQLRLGPTTPKKSNTQKSLQPTVHTRICQLAT